MPYPPPGYGHSDPRACDFYARDQAYRYAQREREYAYSYAYDDCMRGFRR